LVGTLKAANCRRNGPDRGRRCSQLDRQGDIRLTWSPALPVTCGLTVEVPAPGAPGIWLLSSAGAGSGGPLSSFSPRVTSSGRAGSTAVVGRDRCGSHTAVRHHRRQGHRTQRRIDAVSHLAH